MTDWGDAVEPLEGVRSLVDVWAGDHVEHARLVGRLADLMEETDIEVLSLGPPLRLSVDAASFVTVLDRIAYERVRIRFWPFGLGGDGS